MFSMFIYGAYQNGGFFQYMYCVTKFFVVDCKSVNPFLFKNECTYFILV